MKFLNKNHIKFGKPLTCFEEQPVNVPLRFKKVRKIMRTHVVSCNPKTILEVNNA